MTVSVTFQSTGEVFQCEAENLIQLQNQIFETKGIPQGYQMYKDQNGQIISALGDDSSNVSLHVNLNGGCAESCGCCGCGESCSCTIL